jgi:carboxypeptidase E/carboxypeptidase D
MWCQCFAVHDGDYWRLLTPGQYIITTYRDGYHPLSHRVNVYDRPHREAQRVDFYLEPILQLVSSSVSQAPGSQLQRKNGLALK